MNTPSTLRRRVPAVVVGAALLITAIADASPERLKRGQQLYREGVLPSGETVTASVRGDIELGGEHVICSTCHRRSGMGSSEGEQVIPAAAGGLLFKPLRLPTSKPPLAPLQRPAYDRDTLKRAIRTGIDANGKPLDPLMPRYALSDDDLDLLIDYLETLSATPSPGVGEHTIHFATIVAGSVQPSVRKALADVMQVFADQKNRETRNESKRAQDAPWHKHWLFSPYRKWAIHVWDVTGPRESWREQLQRLYEQQPVFAVLSGVAEGSWRPMHEFCESLQLPCLFPTTDLPVIAEQDFYSLYLSKGMTLEGELIGRHQRDARSGIPLVQVYRNDDPRAQTAAKSLLSLHGVNEVRNITWQHDDERPDSVFWEETLRKSRDGYLTVWMNTGDVTELWPLLAQADGTGPERVYLSTTLFGLNPEHLPQAARDLVYLVHTRELPSRTNRLLARSTGWFRVKNIYAPQARQVQANAYLSLKVAGDALNHLRGYFYRDYLIERIEHIMDSVPYTSVYPRISLAPGQRFAAKGGYITRFPASDTPALVSVTDWVTP